MHVTSARNIQLVASRALDLDVIQLAMAVGTDIFQLLQRRPLQSKWEPVPGAVCWSTEKSQSSGYVQSTMKLYYVKK
jgi:hypothetical protein